MEFSKKIEIFVISFYLIFIQYIDIMISSEVSLMTVLNQRINEAPWFTKLAVLRIMNGWSMREVAERICVHSRIYQNWERGRFKPRPFNQVRLANLYGVPQEEIFSPVEFKREGPEQCLEHT
jgi:DNA-binding XRE family transcriptional regulator